MKLQSPTFAAKPRFDILDGLRGVAALMVVAFHLLEVHSGEDHTRQIINHGYLAVDFFFALSGFVIGYAYDDRWAKGLTTWGFFRRRLIRLHPMVVFGTLLGAALFYFGICDDWKLIADTSLSRLALVTLICCTIIPIGKSMDIRGWSETNPLMMERDAMTCGQRRGFAGDLNRVAIMAVVAGLAIAARAAAVPAFDVKLVADSPDCTYVDYCTRTPRTFAEVDGRSVVTFHYLKRSDPKFYDTMWGLCTRPFAVTPGYDGVMQLVLSGRVANSANPGGRLYWLDAEGKRILHQDALGRMSPLAVVVNFPGQVPAGRDVATAWTRFRVPDNARQAKFELKVDLPDLKEGQTVTINRCAYYEHARGVPNELDDLEAPTLDVVTASPCADFNAPLRFRISDATGVNEAVTTVKIDGRVVPFASLAREDGVLVYRPEVPWKEGTIHEIAIDAEDVRGNRGTDCGFVAFTVKPRRHPKWAIRDDGMPLKDGKAFFPFGWFRLRPCAGNGFDMDRGVREMLENGLNAGHTYMARRDGPKVNALLQELADICERRDLLLYVEPSCRNPDAASFLSYAEQSLFAGRERRLSFLWGIGDDTSMQVSPGQLRRYYRVCKAVDPDALTVSADVVGAVGLYEPYLPYFDIVAVESYALRDPVPQDGEMAKTAANIDGAWRDVGSAGIPCRSVMALPQTFKGWKSWKRQPTIEEIKAQAYITAACRARGIMFYASTGQRHHLREASTNIEMSATCPLDIPELKEQFFAFSREFSKLLPSLAGRDAERQPVVKVLRGGEKNVLGGASVRCLLKEDGLLIAANTSHREVAAEIVLPDGRKLEHVFPRFGYLVERQP